MNMVQRQYINAKNKVIEMEAYRRYKETEILEKHVRIEPSIFDIADNAVFNELLDELDEILNAIEPNIFVIRYRLRVAEERLIHWYLSVITPDIRDFAASCLNNAEYRRNFIKYALKYQLISDKQEADNE